MRPFLFAVLLAAGAAQAQPIRLHPENPHYFLFRGVPAVLLTSGEHYGAVLNLDFDYTTYLETLHADGLNLTRLFTGMYVEPWGAPWNTLNPAPGRYAAPWARSDTPGYADGGNRFDLARWDEAYFTRLKDFVAEAGRRGIVVEVVLFCVFYSDDQWVLSPLNAQNNVNGIGTQGRHAVYDETDPAMMRVQEELVRKVVRELKGFDNVYFELCNEPYWDEGPRLGEAWNDRIVAAIRAETTDHLVALNVANDSARVDVVPAGVDVLNFHYAAPPNAVAMNDHHDRPIGDDETGFDGPGDDAYRREAWDFLAAGGAVFSNLDWSFTVDTPDGTSTAADDHLGGGSPTLRRQIGHLKRFFERLPFVRMRPMDRVVRGGVPAGATARVLAAEGQAYLIYLNGGRQADLRLDLPAGTYLAEWMNPRTGRIDRTEHLRHAGGEAVLASPRYDGDAGLRLRRF